MITIGIDLGSKCGVAWTAGSTIYGAKTMLWDLKHKPKEHGGARFARFRRSLTALLAEPQQEYRIYFERVMRHLSSDSAHVYGALWGAMLEVCMTRQIKPVGVPVPTLKKYATGRGNADKSQMIRAANERLAWGGSDDNEADALWLLDFGLNTKSEK